MIDFLLAPGAWYYGTGEGPMYVGGLLLFILVTSIIFRLGNMFRTYVKTGSLDTNCDQFMDNFGLAMNDWRKIPYS